MHNGGLTECSCVVMCCKVSGWGGVIKKACWGVAGAKKCRRGVGNLFDIYTIVTGGAIAESEFRIESVY